VNGEQGTGKEEGGKEKGEGREKQETGDGTREKGSANS
jgi:hypothetical protein